MDNFNYTFPIKIFSTFKKCVKSYPKTKMKYNTKIPSSKIWNFTLWFYIKKLAFNTLINYK